jgi:hypothetical protein
MTYSAGWRAIRGNPKACQRSQGPSDCVPPYSEVLMENKSLAVWILAVHLFQPSPAQPVRPHSFAASSIHIRATKPNSVASVRERTPSDRSLSVKLVPTSRGQHNGSLRPYSRISRLQPLLFLPSRCSIVLTRLSGPRSRPTTSQKMW